MNTVLTILHSSVEIADKLHLESVVVVLDQAIYSKAQIIRWQNAEFMKGLVLRLGEFHTAMSFLGYIGKRFCNGGLQDIFIEAGVVTAGSVNSVMSGKHYNRAIRAHKLVSEALHKFRFESYLQTVSEEDANLFRQLVSKLQTHFPEESYFQIAESAEFERFQSSFDKFIASGSTTFQFWNLYIDRVEILLLFLRATREADWNLHISSVRCMLPWFFAYDHQNYVRF
ncbi:hypothetical protein HOLleu_38078 [Holothuria leucospilota]|uniref:Uncharacterized protein n=1 Tax=Holothuria leucospilota TaxID=206669 RepID=A0A9Q0YI69_HOLLE|nr:hypothetical protein HOLleu_38078 [Holothuria leucospilota]